jgi:hypothetical protein
MRRPPTQNRRPIGNNGPPAWLVFLLGVALVFGSYYVWLGISDFIASGGLGIQEATEQAATETATRIAPAIAGGDSPFSGGGAVPESELVVTPVATFTPVPECKMFRITVTRANIRISPNTAAALVDVYELGDEICVIDRAPEATDWYLIDLNPQTRRINEAYVFEEIVEAINPTPTPSLTYTPAPTVTDLPTVTPSITPTTAPTATPDPDLTPTPTPTPTLTPTLPFSSA